MPGATQSSSGRFLQSRTPGQCKLARTVSIKLESSLDLARCWQSSIIVSMTLKSHCCCHTKPGQGTLHEVMKRCVDEPCLPVSARATDQPPQQVRLVMPSPCQAESARYPCMPPRPGQIASMHECRFISALAKPRHQKSCCSISFVLLAKRRIAYCQVTLLWLSLRVNGGCAALLKPNSRRWLGICYGCKPHQVLLQFRLIPDSSVVH